MLAGRRSGGLPIHTQLVGNGASCWTSMLHLESSITCLILIMLSDLKWVWVACRGGVVRGLDSMQGWLGQGF